MTLIILSISVILITLPFYFPDLFFLSFFSFIPILLIIKNSNLKRSFFIGWLFGLIYISISSYWLFYPLHNFSGLNIIFIIILLIALFSLIALFYGLWAYLLKIIGVGAVRVALSWTAIEFLRYKLMSFFPVAYLGYTQSSFKTLLQWADIGGVFLISFLVVLINGYIFKFLINKDKKFLVPILVIILIIGSYGIYKINFRYNKNTEEKFSVGIIQTNIDQSEKWKSANIEKNIDNIFSSANNINDVKLFITPETSLTFDIIRNEYYRNQVLNKLKEFNSYFQFGAQAIKEDPDFKYNSSFLFSSEGKVIERYNKNRLVVFGEKIPFNKLVNIITNKRWHSLAAGEKNNLFEIENKKWKNLICSEIFYPLLNDDLKEFDFIVNQSNEAWFNSGLQQQMWSAAIFRAVESRKTVVKSGNRSVSGVILPSGKIEKMKPLDDVKEMRVDIDLNKVNTFYTQNGNYIGYISLIVVLILSIINLIKRINKSKEEMRSEVNEGKEK